MPKGVRSDRPTRSTRTSNSLERCNYGEIIFAAARHDVLTRWNDKFEKRYETLKGELRGRVCVVRECECSFVVPTPEREANSFGFSGQLQH